MLPGGALDNPPTWKHNVITVFEKGDERVPNVIRTRLVRVGNSMGLRLTRDVRDLVGLDQEVELEVQPGSLVIRPVPRPREGWEEKFVALQEGEDDPDLQSWGAIPNRFDTEEWEW